MGTVCDHYDGGDHCGALTERRYLIGWRCEHHTPARVAGRPEPAPPPAEDRHLRLPDQSRYGTATTDPLGRDGPGWHRGPSGLPVKDKTKGDQDT